MKKKPTKKKVVKSGPAKLYPMQWYNEVNKPLSQRRKTDLK